MNWLDFVIIVIVIFFVVSAYSAGLIREVVTLLAVIFAIIIAGLLYDDLAKDVLVFMRSEDVSRAVSFLILFGCVYLFGQIVAYILKGAAQMVMLGWADHTGGAAFGLLKGLIVVQVLLILFAAYPSLKLDRAIANSEIGSYFVDDVSFLLVILPGEFGDRVDRFLSPQTADIESSGLRGLAASDTMALGGDCKWGHVYPSWCSIRTTSR
ncbi:MAG: CvpA family protein [Dehalococcoidia bacterium]|nr:CvpA family protein [Dehalococcoidia bacterium]